MALLIIAEGYTTDEADDDSGNRISIGRYTGRVWVCNTTAR